MRPTFTFLASCVENPIRRPDSVRPAAGEGGLMLFMRPALRSAGIPSTNRCTITGRSISGKIPRGRGNAERQLHASETFQDGDFSDPPFTAFPWRVARGKQDDP